MKTKDILIGIGLIIVGIIIDQVTKYVSFKTLICIKIINASRFISFFLG